MKLFLVLPVLIRDLQMPMLGILAPGQALVPYVMLVSIGTKVLGTIKGMDLKYQAPLKA
jgi:hypothetical protein